jgi:aryl-alcohol dehydrogenase-like predicted oxidoreductase
MNTRRIGSLEVSVVGLGCNNFGWVIDQDASARVVHAALDAGITLFDTADIYGGTESEVFLGRALAGRRQQAIVATKFGMRVDAERQGASPKYVRRAAEDSLRRLGMDRIDLYQLHQPDPAVPIAETLGALDELVREGKVREIGCSNFSGTQLREAAAGHGKGVAFASVQNEFSLLHREPEREVLSECARLGVAFIPFFPLASGLLTGKYQPRDPAPAGTRLAQDWAAGRFFTDDKRAIAGALATWAKAHGHSLLELAVSWLASHQVVASVIAGATSPEQVRLNAAAAVWRLSDADLSEIDRIAPLKAAASQ